MSKTPVADYDFNLPEELIAQNPAKTRGTSRLMHIHRKGGVISDGVFTDIIDMIDENCFLVVNSTRVMKARLYAKKPTGGIIELLVLESMGDNACLCLTKGNIKEGTQLNFPEGSAVIEEMREDGTRLVRFSTDPAEVMHKFGHIPLPPYIRREDTESDADRYQTVYSGDEASVAAPTAGLHFTAEILEKLKAKGVQILELTLNIGIGTFRPVKTDWLEDHDMHWEKYYISPETAKEINHLRADGRQLVAVGTTAVRALESAYEDGNIKSGYGETNLFIKPGYKFKVIDSMITNFHLPKSTLLVLVSMFAGYDLTMKAYGHAVKEKYKFFSYGDAMYIE
ncbi:tRNA preQ1(34) S-adenosylmethionine ribosyltransferase-isomerase QueA [Seleniivibrio woodruffii]|uniref:tRNA preQ1(34) S-adenosylmethionine ribosyltransferase-isomerase QueA n=1 Tax=Seleniivibrio woodruffii TaxID=1078050 RepID=UPI00350E36DB